MAAAAVIAGRSGWKNPKLAAAASQIGGKAVAYLQIRCFKICGGIEVRSAYKLKEGGNVWLRKEEKKKSKKKREKEREKEKRREKKRKEERKRERIE